MKSNKKSRTRLIVASTEANADMYYAVRFPVPDPFVFVEHQGRRLALLSDLEIDRGRREAAVDEVVPLSAVAARITKSPKKRATFPEVVVRFLKDLKVRSADVPSDFPLGLAKILASEGINLRPVKGHFWPDREFKLQEEIDLIEHALRVTALGMQVAIERLKEAQIRKKDDVLVIGRSVLTAEVLRAEIESALLREGAVGKGQTIVACGEQACDPHERGIGPLRANELIIIDIFPRIVSTGYYGDMTRTVVRGKATDAQRDLWNTCLQGQKLALGAIAPSVDGSKVENVVREFFGKSGYPTEQRDGRWTGFFHGLGHGLGLEVHEAPRIASTKFKPGQVVTVEPGLYVPGIGGVRHEDVVAVTERGNRILSRFPKPFEI